MQKRILLFSRDPGGVNTIFPLINALKRKNYTVLLFGKDIALSRYQQFGYYGNDISQNVPNITINHLVEFLKSQNPDFIITGTSENDFTEKFLWKAAEQLKIPSFAILDYWVNYGIRFSEFDVSNLEEFEKNRIHHYLPTKVLVMDEYARKEMIQEGFPQEKILISGHPYFDFLKDIKEKVNIEEITNFRTKLGCSKNEFLITFASEPISACYNISDAKQCYWGYNEVSIFNCIANAIKKIESSVKKQIIINFRPHPKENIEIAQRLQNEFKNSNFKIMINKDPNAYVVILASDLVVGMSSMFLLESLLLGKRILSVQIGLIGKNPFILDQMGIMKSILRQDEIAERLSEFLDGQFKQIDLPRFNYIDDSIQRVIDYMEKILNI